jgi:hypothetical protein
VVAQPVEGDSEDVVDLPRVPGWDLADSDHHLDDLGDVDVRADNARVLGAFEQWLTRSEERGSADLEQLGVLVQVVEQLMGERPLGGGSCASVD